MTHLPPSMCAEMSGAPAWYAVQTAEFMERTAALALRDREFLVYVPTIPEELRGRVDWMAPMLSEYVFVFVWEINKNWRKILSCAGALKVLGPFRDIDIAQLRETERELCKPKRVRKGWRRSPLEIGAEKACLRIMHRRPVSAPEGLTA